MGISDGSSGSLLVDKNGHVGPSRYLDVLPYQMTLSDYLYKVNRDPTSIPEATQILDYLAGSFNLV